jgi:hypothetical protein
MKEIPVNPTDVTAPPNAAVDELLIEVDGVETGALLLEIEGQPAGALLLEPNQE